VTPPDTYSEVIPTLHDEAERQLDAALDPSAASIKPKIVGLSASRTDAEYSRELPGASNRFIQTRFQQVAVRGYGGFDSYAASDHGGLRGQPRILVANTRSLFKTRWNSTPQVTSAWYFGLSLNCGRRPN
jgi:hypothetical protein